MKTLSAKCVVVAFVLVAGLAARGQPALAQLESREAIALQNQIMELRRQVQTLQDQSHGGVSSPTYPRRGARRSVGGGNDIVPQLLARVGALEDQVRELRGRIDETQNLVQRQGAE